MPQTTQIIIKSAIFDRERLLTIHPKYIEFDDKELKSSAPIKFLKSEIVSFRHGVQWMSGFIASSIYCVDIANEDGAVIEIRLKSIYGIRENEIGEKYAAILNSLYDNYFDAVSRGYLKQFEAGNEFNILDVHFTGKGIFLNEGVGLIAWKDIELKVYHTYYSICSVSNGTTYKIAELITDWNAGVLYSVLVQLIKYNKLLAAKQIA